LRTPLSGLLDYLRFGEFGDVGDRCLDGRSGLGVDDSDSGSLDISDIQER